MPLSCESLKKYVDSIEIEAEKVAFKSESKNCENNEEGEIHKSLPIGVQIENKSRMEIETKGNYEEYETDLKIQDGEKSNFNNLTTIAKNKEMFLCLHCGRFCSCPSTSELKEKSTNDIILARLDELKELLSKTVNFTNNNHNIVPYLEKKFPFEVNAPKLKHPYSFVNQTNNCIYFNPAILSLPKQKKMKRSLAEPRKDCQGIIRSLLNYLQINDLAISGANVEAYVQQKAGSWRYKKRLRQIFNAHVLYATPDRIFSGENKEDFYERRTIYPLEKIKIMEHCKNDPLMTMICLICIQTAPRISELLILSKEHLGFKENTPTLLIPKKKTEERNMPIDDYLRTLLNDSLHDRFMNDFLNTSALRKKTQDFWDSINLPVRGTHFWRHTKVLELFVIRGKTIEEIKKWFAHKKTQTTDEYLLIQGPLQEILKGNKLKRIKEEWKTWETYLINRNLNEWFY
jgi:integrase